VTLAQATECYTGSRSPASEALKGRQSRYCASITPSELAPAAQTTRAYLAPRSDVCAQYIPSAADRAINQVPLLSAKLSGDGGSARAPIVAVVQGWINYFETEQLQIKETTIDDSSFDALPRLRPPFGVAFFAPLGPARGAFTGKLGRRQWRWHLIAPSWRPPRIRMRASAASGPLFATALSTMAASIAPFGLA
jgi:hypothetical protein